MGRYKTYNIEDVKQAIIEYSDNKGIPLDDILLKYNIKQHTFKYWKKKVENGENIEDKLRSAIVKLKPNEIFNNIERREYNNQSIQQSTQIYQPKRGGSLNNLRTETDQSSRKWLINKQIPQEKQHDTFNNLRTVKEPTASRRGSTNKHLGHDMYKYVVSSTSPNQETPKLETPKQFDLSKYKTPVNIPPKMQFKNV